MEAERQQREEAERKRKRAAAAKKRKRKVTWTQCSKPRCGKWRTAKSMKRVNVTRNGRQSEQQVCKKCTDECEYCVQYEDGDDMCTCQN